MNNSFYLRLIRTDLKRALRLFPQLLICAVLFIISAFFIIKYSSELLYEDTAFEPLDIAIHVDSESSNELMGFAMVQEMDSYRSAINMIRYETEEGCIDALLAGDVYAAVLVPTGFIKDFMTGDNAPVRIIFNRDNTFEEYLINDLFIYSSAALGIEQAGVYTVKDVCHLYGIANETNAALQVSLDKAYLASFLTKNEVFGEASFDSLSTYSLEEGIAASMTVLILFMMSFILMHCIKESSPAYMLGLKKCGVGVFRFAASKALSATLMLYPVFLMILPALYFAGLEPSVSGLIYMLPATVIIAVIIVMFSLLIRKAPSANLVIFIAAALLIYLSGGIIPLEQLPKFLQDTAGLNPMTYLLQYVRFALF